ncbi:hypothetical protein GM708_07585 [Vibrio cholerae]|nr:hypothetical protein [Vibrio cholerae]
MPTAAETRQAEIDLHPSIKDTIDYINEYAWRATKIARGPEAQRLVRAS